MRVIRLLLVLFVCAVPAAADTIYRVDGATTFTGVAGNNNCNGPCIETVAFSFLVSYTPLFGGSFFQANVRSVLSLVSIGPLPPFTSLGPSSTGDFFGLGNSEGDELDLVGPNGENSPPTRPFPVLLPFSDFFGCSSVATAADSVCVRDFALPGLTFGHIGGGPLEYTVTTVATPEGSTRLYLLVGVGLGLLGMLARTQKYCSGLPPG
jgi:hypothetical protein